MRAQTVTVESSMNKGSKSKEVTQTAPMAGRRSSLQRNVLVALLSTCMSLASAGALAHRHGRDSGMQRGIIKCGGNSFVRLGGTELHFASYVFRNLSSKSPINVDRLVFYDATGSVLFDSKISGFPLFSNGVLGPNDQTLKPNQTGQLEVLGLLPLLNQWQRPIQLEIKWSSRENVPALSVDLVRLVQQLDPVTHAQGAEKTRDSQDCDEIGDLE